MKSIWITFLFIYSNNLLFGQDTQAVLLQAKHKSVIYQVALKGEVAKVFRIGSFYNHHTAYRRFTISKIDTLFKQSEEVYTNQNKKIIIESNKIYLLVASTHRKPRNEKLVLDTIKSTDEYHQLLNNAYFMDAYFKLYKELETIYPFANLDDLKIWSKWDKIQYKTTIHTQFKDSLNKQLRVFQDSIITQQENCVKLQQYIINHITSIDYEVLKDSVAKLPKDYHSSFKYFDEVVVEVAKQQPSYFFKLAKDFSEYDDFIFMRVENDKQLVQKLKATESNPEIKKKFVKHLKTSKRMKYWGVGSYVIGYGLLGWLIISLF